MALSGPDNLGTFRRRRHKKLPFPGLASGRRPFSLVNSNPYISTYSSPPVNWELPDPKYTFTPEGWVPIPNPSSWPDPGLWAGDERVWRGITIPQTPRKIEEPTVASSPQYDYTMDASAGGAAPTPFTRRKGGFKRGLKHLAAMESPGLDFGLEAKKSGVPSPWSPTNVAWSPVGGTMFDWKKKRTA